MLGRTGGAFRWRPGGRFLASPASKKWQSVFRSCRAFLERGGCKGTTMPANQIQYSEKYYDSVYEVRAQAMVRGAPALRSAKRLAAHMAALAALVAPQGACGAPRGLQCCLPPFPCADISHCAGRTVQARGAAAGHRSAAAQGPPAVRGTAPDRHVALCIRASLPGRGSPSSLLACRTSGGRLAFSRAVAGCTTPSTDQSLTSCSSGWPAPPRSSLSAGLVHSAAPGSGGNRACGAAGGPRTTSRTPAWRCRVPRPWRCCDAAPQAQLAARPPQRCKPGRSGARHSTASAPLTDPGARTARKQHAMLRKPVWGCAAGPELPEPCREGTRSAL